MSDVDDDRGARSAAGRHTVTISCVLYYKIYNQLRVVLYDMLPYLLLVAVFSVQLVVVCVTMTSNKYIRC